MRVILISWGNNLIQAPPARCLCDALFGILHTEANSFYNYYLWHLMCVSLASRARQHPARFFDTLNVLSIRAFAILSVEANS